MPKTFESKSILDHMRDFNLRFSRTAGGRLYFAYIPTGDEWLYFKSWESVVWYIKVRLERNY